MRVKRVGESRGGGEEAEEAEVEEHGVFGLREGEIGVAGRFVMFVVGQLCPRTIRCDTSASSISYGLLSTMYVYSLEWECPWTPWMPCYIVLQVGNEE